MSAKSPETSTLCYIRKRPQPFRESGAMRIPTRAYGPAGCGARIALPRPRTRCRSLWLAYGSAAKSDADGVRARRKSRAGVYSWGSAPRGERRTLRIASAVAREKKEMDRCASDDDGESVVRSLMRKLRVPYSQKYLTASQAHCPAPAPPVLLPAARRFAPCPREPATRAGSARP